MTVQEIQNKIQALREVILQNLHNFTVVDHCDVKIAQLKAHLAVAEKEQKHLTIQEALAFGDDETLLEATKNNEELHILAKECIRLMDEMGGVRIQDAYQPSVERINIIREQLLKQ